MADGTKSEVPVEGVPRPEFLGELGAELGVAAATLASTIGVSAQRVAVLADTHCRSADAEDLPDTVLEAIADCDLILHCGDLTSLAVLDRLGSFAPVLSVRSEIDPPADGVRLFDGPLLVRAGHTLIGMSADIPENMDPSTLFGTEVDISLSGTSHVPHVGRLGSTLLVNPGSPTIPLSNSGPTLVTIDLDGPNSTVHIVHLPRSRS